MQKSKIEWTEGTWNPVTGCTKVSQGCKNCYAERIYERFHGHGSFKQVICHKERLQQPFKIKKPSMIFVNSMSDLFHEAVSFDFIDEVFAVMMCCPQHIFQILTKRPKRMLEWFSWKNTIWKNEGMQGPERIRYQAYHSWGKNIDYDSGNYWPLKNVWIGVSCEDQKNANDRIHYLNMVPAAVKFISCEPLLGAIDFEKAIGDSLKWHAGGLKNCIGWVIAGGESGPHARPMHPDWVRSLHDQCAANNIPFFFKQWGEWAPVDTVDPTGDIIWLIEKDGHLIERKKPIEHICINHHGYTSKRADDVICKTEENQILYRFGKYISGNILDGKQYLEFPKITVNG